MSIIVSSALWQIVSCHGCAASDATQRVTQPQMGSCTVEVRWFATFESVTFSSLKEKNPEIDFINIF